MTMTTNEEQQLLALSDEGFRSVVNDDLRKLAPPETSAALRSPAVFERWWGMLLMMSRSIDGQLGARREEFLADEAVLLRRIRHAEKELRRLERRGDVEKIERTEDVVEGLHEDLSKLREDFHRSRSGSLRFKSGLDEWIVQAATIRRMRHG